MQEESTATPELPESQFAQLMETIKEGNKVLSQQIRHMEEKCNLIVVEQKKIVEKMQQQANITRDLISRVQELEKQKK